MTSPNPCQLTTTTYWFKRADEFATYVQWLEESVTDALGIENRCQGEDRYICSDPDYTKLAAPFRQRATTYAWQSYVDMQKRLQNPDYNALVQSRADALVYAAEILLKATPSLYFDYKNWWGTQDTCAFVNEMLRGRNKACVEGPICDQIQELASKRIATIQKASQFRPQLDVVMPDMMRAPVKIETTPPKQVAAPAAVKPQAAPTVAVKAVAPAAAPASVSAPVAVALPAAATLAAAVAKPAPQQKPPAADELPPTDANRVATPDRPAQPKPKRAAAPRERTTKLPDGFF